MCGLLQRTPHSITRIATSSSKTKGGHVMSIRGLLIRHTERTERHLFDEIESLHDTLEGAIPMQRLTFSTTINAPKEKIWKTMLDDASYRQWTSAFHEGSYAVTDWKVGSKALFLG